MQGADNSDSRSNIRNDLVRAGITSTCTMQYDREVTKSGLLVYKWSERYFNSVFFTGMKAAYCPRPPKKQDASFC